MADDRMASHEIGSFLDRSVIDDVGPIGVLRLELLPEILHLDRGNVIGGNEVVEGDQPIVNDERFVQFEVLLHSLVRVVAVDEEEVDRVTIEFNSTARLTSSA